MPDQVTVRRHVVGFSRQFAELVESGQKRQTIRTVRKRAIQVGDELRLYAGLRQKGARLLGVGRVTEVHPIMIAEQYVTNWDTYLSTGGSHGDAFAELDGFGSALEMVDWFRRTHGLPFVGVVIRWADHPDITQENIDLYTGERRCDAMDCARRLAVLRALPSYRVRPGMMTLSDLAEDVSLSPDVASFFLADCWQTGAAVRHLRRGKPAAWARAAAGEIVLRRAEALLDGRLCRETPWEGS